MAVFLFLMSVLTGFFATLVFFSATTSIQEGVGSLFFLITAVLFCTFAIINSIETATTKVIDAIQPKQKDTAPSIGDNSPSGERPLRSK